MIVVSKNLNGRLCIGASQGHLNPQCDLKVSTGYQEVREHLLHLNYKNATSFGDWGALLPP